MNRLAACAVVGICLSSFACKSASIPAPPPPPTPTLAFPADCEERHGMLVQIPVDKTASVAAKDQCIVLDKGAVAEWVGANDVKTVLTGWKPKSSICSEPPIAPPSSAMKNCQFTAPNPNGTQQTLCYGITVIDSSGKYASKDPRLIIRP